MTVQTTFGEPKVPPNNVAMANPTKYCVHPRVEARSNPMRVWGKTDGRSNYTASDYIQTRHYCLECGRLVPASLYTGSRKVSP